MLLLILLLSGNWALGFQDAEAVTERAALQAVIDDGRIFRIVGGRNDEIEVTSLEASTALAPLHPWVNGNAGLTVTSERTGQIVGISQDIIDSAKQQNRRPLGLRGLRLPADVRFVEARLVRETPTIQVSRPGFSKDGTRAIVAVTVLHPGGRHGYTLYLEWSDGQWRIAAQGGLWIT